MRLLKKKVRLMKKRVMTKSKKVMKKRKREKMGAATMKPTEIDYFIAAIFFICKRLSYAFSWSVHI